MTIFSAALWSLVACTSLFGWQADRPTVTIYRSWRADVTVVEGMFRVDPALLGTRDCSYGVQLIVRDQQGTVLKDEEWTGQCPVQNGVVSGALETFEFAMPAVTYTVEVRVFPVGAPTLARTAVTEVTGLEGDPLVSDLILAREIGLIDSVNASSWTMRRGGVGLKASSQVVIDPETPRLGFYIELYADSTTAMNGAVVGVIRRRDGRELARQTLSLMRDLREPQPVAGAMSVEGLPPGSYTFEAQVQLQDSLVVRAHPFYFGVAHVATALDQRGWFYTLSDERLGELFDPVVVWLTTAEQSVFRGLTPDGKREFLSQQFGRGGPTPNDGNESALDAYISRIEQVNIRFGERAGRGMHDAWLTDRGRVYLLRGEPATLVTRPSPQSGAPYELWAFTGQQPYVYLFADDTRMGHFRLVYSNDPNEQSLPDWARKVGTEAFEDMTRLGFRPRVDLPAIPSGSQQ